MNWAISDLAIIVRFFHFGAMTLCLGAFSFLLLVARPAFKQGGETLQPALELFDQRLFRLAGWGLLVALVSGLAWLWAQAALVTGQPLGQALTRDAIIGVLTKTQFGRLWQLRLGLIVLLGALLLFRDRQLGPKDRFSFALQGLVLAGALSAALAWAGHASATSGRALGVHLAADSVHLTATGVWLGGLPMLALLLTQARRSQDAAWLTVARSAIRRFSAIALASVSALALTGLVNSYMIVADIAHLVGTAYGKLLLTKLGLLLPLIAVAAMNLLRLKPRLVSAPAESREELHELLRRLRRNVIGESCLGAAILLVVGALGVTPPARHIAPVWPFPFRLSWEAVKDLSSLKLALTIGGIAMLLAIGLLSYGLLRERRRAWAIGIGFVLLVGSPVLPFRAVAIEAYPTTYVRPAVPYTALSIANGGRLYDRHCAACHGLAGYGDGPSAAGLSKPPADLTAKHVADHTAGDIFWWLTHGMPAGVMPGFKERVSERERWELINFLRALASAEEARRLSSLVEPSPWLVAPDFTYGIGVGLGKSLKEHRGKAIVYLVLFSLPSSLERLEAINSAWGEITFSGVRILAVPARDADQVYRLLGIRAGNIPVVVDGSTEIVDTYALFRRTMKSEGVPPPPAHMEFLIDRQGYVRARWIPGEEPGWSEIPRLIKEVSLLAREPVSAPPPDEHVH